MAPNKQLQWTVRDKVQRQEIQRAAAELRRWRQASVVDAFEAGSIRPLGLVTLYFAYAEGEVDGELTLGDEIVEVKVISPAELATFDFGPLKLTNEIVSSWLPRASRASA
jgi:hypothetical protein